MALNPRQKSFVEAYTGNATEAALQAGYSPKTAYSHGQRLLKHDEVSRAIRERAEERRNTLIASREQRQAFWTATMNDPEERMSDRIRASELLGKSEGDFLERMQAQVEQVQPPVFEIHFIEDDELDENGRFKDPSKYE